MSQVNNSRISNIDLAPQGHLAIDWARRHSPLVDGFLRERLNDGALAGRRVAVVVHLEAKTAFLATVLADAGAEVVKIERPEGDFARFYDSAVVGESTYFVWLNAGKKSVVLDLRSDRDLAALKKLIRSADVLVQNLKPGALVKLGVDLAEVHEQRPEFISVSISGFSPDGPGHQRKAYDLLMQAESGLADITGSPHAPGRVGVSIVDIATGMFAYEAVLGALIQRGTTGVGAAVAVSLFDAVAEMLAVPYLLQRYGGGAPQRVGLAHPGICPYGVFVSADEQRFVLSVQNSNNLQGAQQKHLIPARRVFALVQTIIFDLLAPRTLKNQ